MKKIDCNNVWYAVVLVRTAKTVWSSTLIQDISLSFGASRWWQKRPNCRQRSRNNATENQLVWMLFLSFTVIVLCYILLLIMSLLFNHFCYILVPSLWFTMLQWSFDWLFSASCYCLPFFLYFNYWTFILTVDCHLCLYLSLITLFQVTTSQLFLHFDETILHSHTHTTILWPSWILSRTTRVSRHQKGKTRKVKPIWIYRSKRYWAICRGPYANLHLDPVT